MKIAFINLTPSISAQQVYYDKSTYGSTLQLNFSTGMAAGTKFYRMFNVKTNFLGLDINNLRHIITPTASYSYGNNSTMPSGDLRIGGGASVPVDDAIALELSNKLQTKRKSQSVDIVDFKVSSNYNITPKTGTKRGSSFSDFLFELKLLPYSWMSFNADTTYNHYEDYFSNVNWDMKFNFSEGRSIGFGHRYQRKAGKEITFDVDWRLHPKWKFGIYERYQFARIPGYKRGLREQEYFISRDLHCWTLEITYNVTRDKGESIWFVFRLKAFPELEFDLNQSYHEPKPGSQLNP